MIAIPIDIPASKNTVISEYFGHVGYFALFSSQGRFVQTVANQGRGSGRDLSRFLAEQGVTQVVFRHLGDRLFGWLRRKNIESYALGDQPMSVYDAVSALGDGTLERVTDGNLGRLLHPAGPGNGSQCESGHHEDS